MDTTELQRWLIRKNKQYSLASVPHIRRPWDALRDLAKESSSGIGAHSPLAGHIFSWFERNSPPGAHNIGTVYRGAFYLDNAFWEVRIGLLIGCARIDPVGSLSTMPDLLKRHVTTDKETYVEFMHYWCDCWDLIYGYEEIEKAGRLIGRFGGFLTQAYNELRGASDLLLSSNVNLRAGLSFRLATEIFLKAALVKEEAANDRDLRKLGHSIAANSSACKQYLDRDLVGELVSTCDLFPNMSSRYEVGSWDIELVARANVQAHRLGAEVIRRYSHFNARRQIDTKLAAIPESEWDDEAQA